MLSYTRDADDNDYEEGNSDDVDDDNYDDEQKILIEKAQYALPQLFDMTVYEK